MATAATGRADRPYMRTSHRAVAPDGSRTATIQRAVEHSMGNPTVGTLRISDGFELPNCGPAFLWSDDSKYLAVPQWRRSFWAGMRQRLVIVDVERGEVYASRFSGWLLLPKIFERGRLEVWVSRSAGISFGWKSRPLLLEVPAALSGFIALRAESGRARYGGGDGGTIESAVAIEADDALAGIRAEYTYIERKHGEKDADWEVLSQALMERDGRHYDVLTVKLKSGEASSYYFDITSFFGSFPGDAPDDLTAVCPHCRRQQQLIRWRLPVMGKVLRCPACLKFSRAEGMGRRVFGVVLLMPIALALAPAIATGLYFLASMPAGEFSLGFAAIGLVLVLVPGYAEYRTVLAIRRFLRPGELLRIEGFQTGL